jgi:hypothetical protein
MATAWATLDPFEEWQRMNPGAPATVYIGEGIVERKEPLVVKNPGTRLVGMGRAQILGSVALGPGKHTLDERIDLNVRANVLEWEPGTELAFTMPGRSHYSCINNDIFFSRWSGIGHARNDNWRGGIARVCHGGKTLLMAQHPGKTDNGLPNDLGIANIEPEIGYADKRGQDPSGYEIERDAQGHHVWVSSDERLDATERATCKGLTWTGVKTPDGSYDVGEVFLSGGFNQAYFNHSQFTVNQIDTSGADSLVYVDPALNNDWKSAMFSHGTGTNLGNWNNVGDEFDWSLQSIYELDESGMFWTDIAGDKVFAWLPSAAGETTRLQVNQEAVIQIEADSVLLQGLEIGEAIGDGVQVRQGSDVEIKDCVTRSCGRWNVCVFPDLAMYRPVRRFKITGGKTFDAGMNHVFLGNGYCPRNQPPQNDNDAFEGGEFGARYTYSSEGEYAADNVVDGLELEGSPYLGFRFDQFKTWGRGNTIRKCHFHDGGGCALKIEYGDYVTVEDNLFENFGSLSADWCCIRSEGWPRIGYGHHYFRRNHFKNVRKDIEHHPSVQALYPDFQLDHVYVEDNVFQGCDVVCRFYGMNGSFKNNTMIDCGYGWGSYPRTQDGSSWAWEKDANGNPKVSIEVSGNEWIGGAPGLNNGQTVYQPSDATYTALFEETGIKIDEFYVEQGEAGGESRLIVTENEADESMSEEAREITKRWS